MHFLKEIISLYYCVLLVKDSYPQLFPPEIFPLIFHGCMALYSMFIRRKKSKIDRVDLKI
jgi:hypothetical protein